MADLEKVLSFRMILGQNTLGDFLFLVSHADLIFDNTP